MVIGIGNLILSDDAVGPLVARQAESRLVDLNSKVDFEENFSGGLDLLDLLEGHRRAILVDSIVTGNGRPGTCHLMPISSFDAVPQTSTWSAHEFNLSTLMELGRRCAYTLPKEIVVIGIEAEDLMTFSESPTELVEAAMDDAVSMIERTIQEWIDIDINNPIGVIQ